MAYADHLVQAGPLPEVPAASLAVRVAAHRKRRRRFKSRRLAGNDRMVRVAVLPPADHARFQNATRGRDSRFDGRIERGSAGAGSLYADSVERSLPPTASTLHQYSALDSAKLQGRQALSSRA